MIFESKIIFLKC